MYTLHNTLGLMLITLVSNWFSTISGLGALPFKNLVATRANSSFVIEGIWCEIGVHLKSSEEVHLCCRSDQSIIRNTKNRSRAMMTSNPSAGAVLLINFFSATLLGKPHGLHSIAENNRFQNFSYAARLATLNCRLAVSRAFFSKFLATMPTLYPVY